MFEQNLGAIFFFGILRHVMIKLLFFLATSVTPLEMRIKMDMDLTILEDIGSDRVIHRESAMKSIQSNSMKPLDLVTKTQRPVKMILSWRRDQLMLSPL